MHVRHGICKQCDREHGENLASVFPFISLPDRAQIVRQIVLGISNYSKIAQSSLWQVRERLN